MLLPGQQSVQELKSLAPAALESGSAVYIVTCWTSLPTLRT
jgi:hypothetical protein